jgi:protein TonB
VKVVTVAGGGLAGLEDIWDLRRPRTRGAVIGTAVALCLHVVVALALLRVDTSRLFRGETTVEMEVQEPPPPPPEVKPETPPPPPPPAPEVVRPRLVVHRAAAPTPPTEAPPPPSETPPKATEAPPVFGVSLDSTVAGDGPGMAVPVGNTLMTKPHKAATAPVAPLAGVGGDSLPAPVPEIYISEQPKVIHEVSAEYPSELRRMGIEGTVTFKVYVDENGNVRRVTVIEKAGHGFDELAREALKKFKFSPPRTSDGKAVPTNIVYKYRFELPQ